MDLSEEEWKEFFGKLDEDNDGKLDVADLQILMPNPESATELLNLMNPVGGKIEFEDFYKTISKWRDDTKANDALNVPQQLSFDENELVSDDDYNRPAGSLFERGSVISRAYKVSTGIEPNTRATQEEIPRPEMNSTRNSSPSIDSPIRTRDASFDDDCESTFLEDEERIHSEYDPMKLTHQLEQLKYENENLHIKCQGMYNVGREMENDNRKLHETVQSLKEQVEEVEGAILSLKATNLEYKNRLAVFESLETHSKRNRKDSLPKRWSQKSSERSSRRLSLESALIETHRKSVELELKMTQENLMDLQTKKLKEVQDSRKRWIARVLMMASTVTRCQRKIEDLLQMSKGSGNFDKRWSQATSLKTEVEALRLSFPGGIQEDLKESSRKDPERRSLNIVTETQKTVTADVEGARKPKIQKRDVVRTSSAQVQNLGIVGNSDPDLFKVPAPAGNRQISERRASMGIERSRSSPPQVDDTKKSKKSKKSKWSAFAKKRLQRARQKHASMPSPRSKQHTLITEFVEAMLQRTNPAGGRLSSPVYPSFPGNIQRVRRAQTVSTKPSYSYSAQNGFVAAPEVRRRPSRPTRHARKKAEDKIDTAGQNDSNKLEAQGSTQKNLDSSGNIPRVPRGRSMTIEDIENIEEKIQRARHSAERAKKMINGVQLRFIEDFKARMTISSKNSAALQRYRSRSRSREPRQHIHGPPRATETMHPSELKESRTETEQHTEESSRRSSKVDAYPCYNDCQMCQLWTPTATGPTAFERLPGSTDADANPDADADAAERRHSSTTCVQECDAANCSAM